MKPLIIILTMLFLSLQYKLWFVREGVWQVHQLKKQIASQVKENRQLSQRNHAMVTDISHLKSDEAALEAHARHDLNMVKPNELFYILVDKIPEKKKKERLY
ncbi:cell division protein FtsB [Rickettsiella grylli]|uniref:Cell division protein FtsB n=2 Tax=Rickettsiella grylli TaxID=59196 RepID=A8PLE8_9COXI|nr:septum formation initiator family protein [Rickettsiella grylli]EDP46762.1 cell divison protein FtsB [Rickettsiella grylli]OJA00715.1 cell division protein FtsB [Rickettsiella grylli]